MKKRIWYKKSANMWEEALPIGNGRIGGGTFSGVEVVARGTKPVSAPKRRNHKARTML